MKNFKDIIQESEKIFKQVTVKNQLPNPVTQNQVEKKYKLQKIEDRNGNGTDVFNASNVKTFNRAKNHYGYTPDNDESVYESIIEEVESLDELSKKTLSNYITRASTDMATSAGRSGLKKGANIYRDKKYVEKTDDLDKNTSKRHIGIMKAARRLGEEVESLDEISKKKLGNYVIRANRATEIHGFRQGVLNQKSGDPDLEYNEYKLAKRRKAGVEKAIRKLTKEETNLVKNSYEISYEDGTTETMQAGSSEEVAQRAKAPVKKIRKLNLQPKQVQEDRFTQLYHLHKKKALETNKEIDKLISRGSKYDLKDPLIQKLKYHKNMMRKYGNSISTVNEDLESLEEDRDIIGYKLVDHHEGKILKTYKVSQKNSARNYAEKKNQEYGAWRYAAHPVFSEEIEQVNEISKKKLGQYIKKATDDVSYHSYKTGGYAVDKLTKESLDEAKNYHSVFYNHEGKWKHHFDADSREDARDEVDSIKRSGDRTAIISVPKHEAKWHKMSGDEIHNYVHNRILKQKPAKKTESNESSKSPWWTYNKD